MVKQMRLNVVVDDRGEKSIGWKLKQHEAIGIPYTIVLGKRLLESIPLYEFGDQSDSSTSWITQAELFDKLRSTFSK
jgi:prolyl-tRNA synthetase